MEIQPTNKELLKELLEAILGVSEAISALATHTDKQISEVRAEMATKDFVDRRISSAVEEIAPTMKRIDNKDSLLVKKLEEKKVISAKESATIVSMSPFPVVETRS